MSETNPKVSIIIPVYNGSNYLAEAIDSALAQTYQNIEVIVVNDGSTDEGASEKIALSYGDNITLISKKNGGVSTALNTGIQSSTGVFIAWLSHDDVFLPHKIEWQVNAMLNNPWASVCYSDYWVIDGFSTRQGMLKMPFYPRDSFLRHLFQCMFLCGSTALVRRDCFESVGLFDESLRFSQDADMWLRIARNNGFVHIAEPLINWRYHSGQGSRNDKKMLADRKKYLSKCLDTFSIEDFFPEINDCADKKSFIAKAHVYLAQIMLSRHREPRIAFNQYLLSLSICPSLTNPAFKKLLMLLCGGWIYYLVGKHVFSFIRRIFPKKAKTPNVDMIAASRVVDF